MLDSVISSVGPGRALRGRVLAPSVVLVRIGSAAPTRAAVLRPPEGHAERLEQVAGLLAKGGMTAVRQWTERIRLWFDGGMAASQWLLASGYISGRSLDQFPKDLLDQLMPIFAQRLEERFGEDGRVPFDFDIGCVIAVRT